MAAGGALQGVLVVAFEQAVAAPFCTCRLADAGARVIKVERPEGDFARGYDEVAHGESSYFVWLNRGKQSLVADIKDPGDAGLLHRVLEKADVFVQNLAPGAAARAGFGSAELRERHPRLITCDISGYGEEGPYAGMKAYDLLIQCESGLASVTGVPEGPGRVGVSIADIASGMYAHAALLEALYERERTGRGKGVAISMFDALADWMAVPLIHADYGRPPARVGLSHPSIAPYGAFPTGDGKQIVFGIQNEREWAVFCREVLGAPEMIEDRRFASNALRVENRTALDAIVANVVRGLGRNALIVRLKGAKIAYGALNSAKEAARHPQLRRIGIDTQTGPVSAPAPPPRWAGEPPFAPGPVPRVGEHTQDIRAEFG